MCPNFGTPKNNFPYGKFIILGVPILKHVMLAVPLLPKLSPLLQNLYGKVSKTLNIVSLTVNIKEKILFNIVLPNTMVNSVDPGPKVIKLFSCSAQLCMKYFQLINVKMLTIVGILTFMSRKNGILGLSGAEKSCIS